MLDLYLQFSLLQASSIGVSSASFASGSLEMQQQTPLGLWFPLNTSSPVSPESYNCHDGDSCFDENDHH